MTLTQQTAPYPHWEYVHPESGDRLRVVPERGGIVTEWRCGDRDVLYFDAERYSDPTKSIRGGIPVLFPICGNLPGDVLPVNGIDYTLKQHGFARNLPWQLQLLDDQTGISLSLSDTDETRPLPLSFDRDAGSPCGPGLEISPILNRSEQVFHSAYTPVLVRSGSG